MTSYVAVYDDLDRETTLSATKTIIEIHRRYEAPATFSLNTEALELDSDYRHAYCNLFNDAANRELFEVLPHSHTHPVFRRHAHRNEAASLEQLAFEVRHSKQLIEEYFGRAVRGFRAPNGYYNGWKGEKHLLQLMADNDIEFFMSFGMGPHDTVPAPLTQPYYYIEDGFPQLLEIPAHDWHDNVLQGWPHLPAMWPPCVPAGLPQKAPQNSQEKFEVYKPNMDWCVEHNLAFYSPTLHPWAMQRFDPSGGYIELMVQHAQQIGMRFQCMSRFADEWRANHPVNKKTGQLMADSGGSNNE